MHEDALPTLAQTRTLVLQEGCEHHLKLLGDLIPWGALTGANSVSQDPQHLALWGCIGCYEGSWKGWGWHRSPSSGIVTKATQKPG